MSCIKNKKVDYFKFLKNGIIVGTKRKVDSYVKAILLDKFLDLIYRLEIKSITLESQLKNAVLLENKYIRMDIKHSEYSKRYDNTMCLYNLLSYSCFSPYDKVFFVEKGTSFYWLVKKLIKKDLIELIADIV